MYFIILDCDSELTEAFSFQISSDEFLASDSRVNPEYCNIFNREFRKFRTCPIRFKVKKVPMYNPNKKPKTPDFYSYANCLFENCKAYKFIVQNAHEQRVTCTVLESKKDICHPANVVRRRQIRGLERKRMASLLKSVGTAKALRKLWKNCGDTDIINKGKFPPLPNAGTLDKILHEAKQNEKKKNKIIKKKRASSKILPENISVNPGLNIFVNPETNIIKQEEIVSEMDFDGFCQMHGCPNHFMCNDCNILVCGTCCVLNHKNCDLSSVKEALSSLKEDKLLEVKTKKDSLVITMEERDKDVQSLKEDLSIAQSHVRNLKRKLSRKRALQAEAKKNLSSLLKAEEKIESTSQISEILNLDMELEEFSPEELSSDCEDYSLERKTELLNHVACNIKYCILHPKEFFDKVSNRIMY